MRGSCPRADSLGRERPHHDDPDDPDGTIWQRSVAANRRTILQRDETYPRSIIAIAPRRPTAGCVIVANAIHELGRIRRLPTWHGACPGRSRDHALVGVRA